MKRPKRVFSIDDAKTLADMADFHGGPVSVHMRRLCQLRGFGPSGARTWLRDFDVRGDGLGMLRQFRSGPENVCVLVPKAIRQCKEQFGIHIPHRAADGLPTSRFQTYVGFLEACTPENSVVRRRWRVTQAPEEFPELFEKFSEDEQHQDPLRHLMFFERAETRSVCLFLLDSGRPDFVERVLKERVRKVLTVEGFKRFVVAGRFSVCMGVASEPRQAKLTAEVEGSPFGCDVIVLERAFAMDTPPSRKKRRRTDEQSGNGDCSDGK